MKVVLGALGAAIIAGLIACSGAAPQSSSASAGVQGTDGAGLNPTTSSSAASSTPAATTASDAGVTATDSDASTDTTTAATPQTCDTLAAAAQTPAGQLQVTSVHGINPVDVYATQDDQALTIVLTETANECGYRLNNLAHQSLKELQIVVPTPQGGFVPGTFNPSQTQSQSGQTCFPQGDDDDDNGFNFGGGGNIGTSFQQGSARGTVTITAIDASSVTGTVDITDFNGREDSFTFTAPICPEVTQQQVQGATCCADPNQH